MKLTKSQLKELIRHAIVEDIMDKEIKNPKTGNKIKVRTALQLPDDHAANKIAKKLVAQSPTKDKPDTGKATDDKADDKDKDAKFTADDDKKSNALPSKDFEKLHKLKKPFDGDPKSYVGGGGTTGRFGTDIGREDLLNKRVMNDDGTMGRRLGFLLDQPLGKSYYKGKEILDKYKEIDKDTAMAASEEYNLSDKLKKATKNYTGLKSEKAKEIAKELYKNNPDNLTVRSYLQNNPKAFPFEPFKGPKGKTIKYTGEEPKEEPKKKKGFFSKLNPFSKKEVKESTRRKYTINEDIMDKEIKNPKTGNKIKVRTALQLPDDHAANKMAKKLVAKTPTKDDEPEKKKGKSVFDKDKPKDKPKYRHPAMNDLDWDEEIPPEDLEGFVDDNKEKISRSSQKRVYDLLDKIQAAHDEERYDDAVFHQKRLQKTLDSYMQITRDDKKAMSVADTPKSIKDIESDGDEQAWADQWDDVESDFENAKDKKRLGRISFDDYHKIKKKHDKFRKVGADNDWLDESIKESIRRKYTIKEVRMWMKKLEENRYKKVYNSDARRVAWMVNNEGRKLDEMPMSMKKKWSKAQYGRERYLAKEFLKSKSEQMNESKLRQTIREIIKEQLNLNEYVGAGKPIPRNKAKQLFVPENEMIRFSRVFKKLIQKGFVYVGDQTKEKKKISKHYTITVDKKMYDNLLDILMSKRFKVKT